MPKFHSDFIDVFTRIGCFEGTFKLRVKEGSCPYQASPRTVMYTLQQPIKEEPDRLQKQQIIVPLDVAETSEWCNSLILVPKANGKMWLYLDPARHCKVLIRPVHRKVTLNNILPRLAGVKYFTLIDTSSSYHNLN